MKKINSYTEDLETMLPNRELRRARLVKTGKIGLDDDIDFYLD